MSKISEHRVPNVDEALVSSAAAFDLLEALRRSGIAADQVLLAAGLNSMDFANANPMAASALPRLFAAAERLSGDSQPGLLIGACAEPRGPLDHLLASCARLEDALMRCRRFGSLLVTTMRIDVRHEAGHFVLEYEFGDAELEACDHMADYTLMATAQSLRRAVGEDAHFLEVHLRRAGEADRERIERAFGCRARFGQAFERLLIPRSVAQREPRMSNPLIAEQIERFAEALLPREPPPSTFTERVVRTARTLLGSGVRAERKLVCRHLGVSERTLHRRLSEEGAAFRDVRERVLWELAEALVSDSDLKLDAVARSVGFNDGAAFSKAFKRRSGCSPIAYRRTRSAALAGA